MEAFEERVNPTASVSVASLGDITEGGSASAFRITRSNNTDSFSVTVNVTGTATNAADYSFMPMIMFTSGGGLTADVSITPMNDSLIEGTETVIVTIVPNPPWYTGSGSATMNLYDDDTPQVTVSKIADAAENGSAGTFRISRTGPTTSSLGVTFTTGGTATSGTDYTSIGTGATIASGNSYVDVTVTALADNVVESGGETVTITIDDGGSSYTANNATASLTIADDPPVVTVQLVNDAVEDGTTGEVSISRTGGKIADAMTVTYSVGGSATPGTDYTALSGSVSLGASVTSANVTIVGMKDSISEGTETVVITVSNSSTHTAGSPSAATVKLIDTTLFPLAFGAWIHASVDQTADISPLDAAVDLDGDTLSLLSITQGEHGTVSTSGSLVSYSPDAGYTGDDAFTYTVIDPDGNEATGTIRVSIFGVSAPPLSLWTALNTPIEVDAAAAAYDLDGDHFTVSSVTNGDHGTVVLNVDGTITYTPDSSYSGVDSFEYTVEDDDGHFSTDTITVSVADPSPITLNGTLATSINTSLHLDILNDWAFNPAGASIDTVSVTQGSHGTVTIHFDGSITYTPDNNYEGSDSFTYTVSDGSSNSSIGTVELVIGDSAESPEDAVAAMCEDLGDHIAAFDDELADIANGTSAIASAFENHIAGSQTFFISLDIESNGRDLTARTYLQDQIEAYLAIKAKYNEMLILYHAFDQLLLASKSLVESLGQTLAALKSAKPPNESLIGLAKSALDQAGSLHATMWEAMQAYRESLEKAHDPVKRAYNALTAIIPTFPLLGGSIAAAWLGSAPSAPPEPDLFRYLPAIP